jgi:CubicO group peptidase (beta-lactamase class C family)
VTVDPAFAAVEEAFRENFATRGEAAAAVCVILEGRTVVDLAAGPGWGPDSLVNAFSVGKGLTAAVLGHAMETAGVALDDPVTRWWPELDLGLSVAQLASHRAGLPALRAPQPEFVMYDWDAMVAALAAEVPWWEPGRAHGYHTNTFGFLVGEVVRRATGRSVGTLLRDLAAPLDADVYIGLPDEEHVRVRPFSFPATRGGLVATEPADEHQLMVRNGYANPPGLSGVGIVNTPAWRRAEIPSTNCHASARGVARFYAGILAGEVLAAETVTALTAVRSDGPDLVLDRPSRFGSGFQLPQPERPFGTGPRAFGHFGAGGALGFADPEADLAFGYVIAEMGPRWQNPRNRALLDALTRCL